MNVYGGIFLLAFVVCILIILAKLYNVMSVCKWYDIRLGFILFIGYFLSWLVELIVFFDYPEKILYSQLFILSSWLITLNTLFFIIELIMYVAENAEKVRMPYNAVEYYRKKVEVKV